MSRRKYQPNSENLGVEKRVGRDDSYENHNPDTLPDSPKVRKERIEAAVNSGRFDELNDSALARKVGSNHHTIAKYRETFGKIPKGPRKSETGQVVRGPAKPDPKKQAEQQKERIEAAVKSGRFSDLADVALAKKLGCHRTTVSKAREALSVTDKGPCVNAATVVAEWCQVDEKTAAKHRPENNSGNSGVEKRVGRDGKARSKPKPDPKRKTAKEKERAARKAAKLKRQHNALKRTNGDKRRAVEAVLKIRPQWTNSRVAQEAGVTHPTVASVRSSLENSSSGDADSSVREAADGRLINIVNIGRKSSASPDDSEDVGFSAPSPEAERQAVIDAASTPDIEADASRPAARRGRAKPRPTGIYVYVPDVDYCRFTHPDAAARLLHHVGHAPRRDERSLLTGMSVGFARDVVGWRRADATINELVDSGLAVTDRQYIVGERARGYGLTKAAVDAGMVRRELQTSSIANALVQRRSNRRRRTGTNDAIDAMALATADHLRNWLHRVHLDQDAARQLIAAAPECDRRPKVAVRRTQKQLAYAWSWADNMLHLTNAMHDAESNPSLHEWTVCPYGRLHTFATRLSSKLRPFISFVGHDEPLVIADVSNSQPVFALAMLIRDRGGRGQLSKQESDFADRVLDGLLYDVLMEDVGFQSTPTARGNFKGQFFQDVLYGDHRERYSTHSPIRIAFAKRWPSVWKWIVQQKGGKNPTDERAYAELARRMQVEEARLMLDGVCGQLAAEHANVPVVTIHDAVVTTHAHGELVRSVILTHFDKLGLRPHVKLEPISTDTLCQDLAESGGANGAS